MMDSVIEIGASIKYFSSATPTIFYLWKKRHRRGHAFFSWSERNQHSYKPPQHNVFFAQSFLLLDYIASTVPTSSCTWEFLESLALQGTGVTVDKRKQTSSFKRSSLGCRIRDFSLALRQDQFTASTSVTRR